MLDRLVVREGQHPDAARRAFDGSLWVHQWGSVARERPRADTRDPKAPWWWEGPQEASDSFLRSMGVML